MYKDMQIVDRGATATAGTRAHNVITCKHVSPKYTTITDLRTSVRGTEKPCTNDLWGRKYGSVRDTDDHAKTMQHIGFRMLAP